MPSKLIRTNTAIAGAIALETILGLPSVLIPRLIAQQLNCNNLSSNVEYKECDRRAYERAERQINQVYQQPSSKLDSAERQELTSTQLVWIQFRDKNCSFEVYPSWGSTGYGGFLSECLEGMTKQRTATLQRNLKQG